MSSQHGAIGWPEHTQGPKTTNEYEINSNPVLRGYTLAIVTKILKSSSFIQGLFWKANKFDQLKLIPDLKLHSPRYDPTVVPVNSTSSSPLRLSQLDVPSVRERKACYYTVGDYHAAFQSGRSTPTDVVEYLLPLISQRDQQGSSYAVAFLEVQADLVRSAAKASTERWKQGRPLSPLDGVPVAVKDEVDLAGYSRSLGNSLDFTNSKNETAWCVQKWQEAGAVIIGKTNMAELGLNTSGNNSTKGTPLMPHNEGYYPGGSSSGSAVAVARGICPVALGADGGGSIRVPSSFCGVYGLKPSHGRVSGRPTLDLAGSVGVYGPMASDLDSLALAYRVMAQPDPESRDSRLFMNSLCQEQNATSPKHIKTLGICRDWVARSDPEVLRLFDDAVQHYCKTQDYKAIDIDLPFLPENQKAHTLTILSEIRGGLDSLQVDQISFPNQLLLTVAGSQASAQDFLAAQKLRNLMMQHLAYLWQQYPGMVVLTPTTPCAGWKIGHPSDSQVGYGISDGDYALRTMEYVYLANWTGCPAMSRPMGFASENVPVGLMAMGEWGSEEQLLAWAREGEGILEAKSAPVPSSLDAWLDVLTNAV